MSTVPTDAAPPPEQLAGLVALREEGEALGFEYGTDFFIWWVPGFVSSEAIVLGVEGERWTVTYTDMGRDRLLHTVATFDEARRLLLDEVARLAGPRGRGPLAGRQATTRYDGMTPDEVYRKLEGEGYF